jgi:hypothetical protein
MGALRTHGVPSQRARGDFDDSGGPNGVATAKFSLRAENIQIF